MAKTKMPNPAEQAVQLLSVETCAERLGVSKAQVHRYIAAKALKTVRLGRRARRVAEPDLAAFINAHRV